MTALNEAFGRFRIREPGNRVRGRARVRQAADGTPVEVIEEGPSFQGRLVWLASRQTIRPLLTVASHVPHMRWPFGLVDFACRAFLPAPDTTCDSMDLPTANAQLVRA